MSKHTAGTLTKPGGRWMVVTGCLASRHRSLSEARSVAKLNAKLRPVLRRYHRKMWDALIAEMEPM